MQEYPRLGLAALGSMIASFAFGFSIVAGAGCYRRRPQGTPAVFRPEEEMMAVMPIGIVETFVAILVVARPLR